MPISQIVGAVLLLVGIVLLIFGFQASDRPLDQLAETFTGRFTDETMWYLIAGTAAAVGGGLLFWFGRRNRG
jgi:LPXTG-motif cell wall-anchored protein